jgi:hypothetical protein
MSPSKRRPTKKKEPASRTTGSSARTASNATSKAKRNTRRAAPGERSGRPVERGDRAERSARAPSRSSGDRLESFRKLSASQQPPAPPRGRIEREAPAERPKVETFDEALQRLARATLSSLREQQEREAAAAAAAAMTVSEANTRSAPRGRRSTGAAMAGASDGYNRDPGPTAGEPVSHSLALPDGKAYTSHDETEEHQEPRDPRDARESRDPRGSMKKPRGSRDSRASRGSRGSWCSSVSS